MTSNESGNCPGITPSLGGSLVGQWRLNSTRSTVALKSKSAWGLTSVKGRFTKVTGEALIGPDGATSGQLTIVTSSLDTANKKRDKHLTSDDFFDAQAFPEITFELSALSSNGSISIVSGTLSIKEQSLPLSFPATVTFANDREVVLDAQFVIDRSEFGMTWNQMNAVSMKNLISAHAVFQLD